MKNHTDRLAIKAATMTRFEVRTDIATVLDGLRSQDMAAMHAKTHAKENGTWTSVVRVEVLGNVVKERVVARFGGAR